MEQTHFSFCWSDPTTSCIILLFQQEEFDPLQLNQLERTCLPVHICIWPCCVGSLETVSFVFIIQSSWSPLFVFSMVVRVCYLYMYLGICWPFFSPLNLKEVWYNQLGREGGCYVSQDFFFKLHWIVFVENKR